MPGPYGVTPTGFKPKTFEDIRDELNASFRSIFGNDINLQPNSVYGQFIALFALGLAEVWALALSVYSSAFRASATGDALQKIGLLTNTPRRVATKTRVLCQLTGTAGTVIPPNQTVAIPGGAKFRNALGATLPATVEFAAVETGVVFARAGTVTQIDTPISGWAGVNNATDQIELGAPEENDTAFRQRQEAQLSGLGGASAASLRSQLIALAGVTEAYVFENETDFTDSNGLPPHSVECVVAGTAGQADVAQVILNNKATGCATFGSSFASGFDANGFPKNIFYSVPTALPIWCVVDLTADQSRWTAASLAAAKAAIVDFATQTFRVGAEVRSAPLLPPLFAANLGVLDAQLPKIGLAAAPSSSATVVVSNRQLAVFDTSRVTINVTLTVP